MAPPTKHTKMLPNITFIFTNNLNNIYVLLNYIRSMSSQYNQIINTIKKSQ
jgi:hypothetical protein